VIRVDSITIKEFRGIRDLTLDFKEKNFAVCGPNGTGKSGVVDALEFALTGSVSRLSGEGSGEISLKQHGPHVDRRNDPDKARVTVKVTIPTLSKTVTVERSLKTPGVAQVMPSDPEVLDALRQVKAHPEIVLSRRELIRYVLAAPGKRADEVRALLHLDQVEQVRRGLQKIANDCEKKLVPLDREVTEAREKLLRAIDLSELTKEKVLVVVNAQRVILGLSAFTDLTETTSLKDGMSTLGLVQPQRIPKVQAIADIRAAREVITEITSDQIATNVAEVTADLSALASDPAVAASVKRETFYTTGMELIEGGACPFCDNSWDLEELKRHVQVKIDHLEEVSRKRTVAEAKITPLIEVLGNLRTAINTLAGFAALATPPVVIDAVREYGTNCGTAVGKLTAFLPLAETITVLTNVRSVPQGVLDAIGDLEKVVAALPEPTKQDAAKEWLTVAQERLEVWRNAVRKQKAAKEQAQRARQVFDIYTATSDTVLAGLYATVEKDFSSLYEESRGTVLRNDCRIQKLQNIFLKEKGRGYQNRSLVTFLR